MRRPASHVVRETLSRDLPLYSYLGSYFLTVVLGNINFAMPWGMATVRLTGLQTGIFSKPTTFSLGYWLLLLIPFVVAPFVAIATRRYAMRPLSRLSNKLRDFGRLDYFVIAAALYSVLAHAFLSANAFALASSGTDATSSVEARFALLGNLGFVNTMILQSLLSFLSFYSIVRSMREPSLFWRTCAVVNVILMSLFLVALNMKWPFLLFCAGVGVCIFLYTRRMSIMKVAFLAILLVSLFLIISTTVYRTSVSSDQEALSAPWFPSAGQGTLESSNTDSDAPGYGYEDTAEPTTPLSGALERGKDIVATSIHLAPLYGAQALNRMAYPYPYYYDVFTTEGAVCGNILAQLKRGVSCRPSLLIYERMFGKDGFAGRGTAPAAAHITAYAEGGWLVTIFILVGLSVVLGLFAVLPRDGTAMAGTLVVVGVLAGYHFSQVPAEGVLFYDHGFGWVLLALAVYQCIRWLAYKLKQNALFLTRG